MKRFILLAVLSIAGLLAGCASTQTAPAATVAPAPAQSVVPAPSGDDMVATNGRDSVRLSDRPCSSKTVLGLAATPLRSKLRDAVAIIADQAFRACWVVESGMAYLIYEDGDQGLVPLTEFRRSL